MTQIVVVDACVAVKWHIKEQDSRDAQIILESNATVAAPDFALAEIGDIL